MGNAISGATTDLVSLISCEHCVKDYIEWKHECGDDKSTGLCAVLYGEALSRGVHCLGDVFSE